MATPSFDVRHRFVFSPVYVVPKFQGSDFSPKNIALAGWEISGIVSLATGFPYDVSYGGRSSASLWCSAGVNFYACPDVPNQTGADHHRRSPHSLSPAPATAPRLRTPALLSPMRIPGSLRQHPPRSLSRARPQQHQHDPGQELPRQLGAQHQPPAAHGKRQRLQPHAVQQPRPAPLADSTFGQVTGAAAGRQSQLALRFTSNTSTCQ